ncbi:hypothetical protein GQX73_g500 [Xylaria multiplex]|uniref:Methyltransferase domain-containing protein n=1 Tax=Xylaria multiplex TaxID=323545 RepID=A0A7C8MXT3_9PEZI|nr:hypothetical protein GQX73_g500 [Xylaria multiplex]
MGAEIPRSFIQVTVVLLLTAVIALIGQVIYNICFHPISKYPGPLLRAAFSLPALLENFAGSSVSNIHALHKQYGSVVRIAPDTLSFSTAQAWKVSDDINHARIRKLLSHAFSDVALKEQTSIVASHIDEFMRQVQMRSSANKKNKVDINAWFNYLAYDIIADLSFGEPLGALKHGQPSMYINEFFKACRTWPMIPLAHEFTLVNLLFRGLMKIPAVRKNQETTYLATMESVDKRMNNDNLERKDFMTYILHHNDKNVLSSAEIAGCTTVLVNGGGEAVASCLSATMFLLLKNPDIHARTMAEVRGLLNLEQTLDFEAVSRLVYLNAVVEESLRVCPPAPGNFARRTNIDTEIDGHVVPPDISVGVHQWSANHSLQNFYQPDQFVPERWLANAPPEYHNDIKGAMQPWSSGPRNCLGKRLAYMEIRMTLARLLWLFNMELSPESDGWLEKQTYNIIWNRTPLYIRVLPRDLSQQGSRPKAKMAFTSYKHTYPLENSNESTRLQNQHEVIKDAMGGLILAPIDLKSSPLRILDSGTADGTWIRDFAASVAPVQHNLYGTDLNPAEFPSDVPPGTVYQAQDVNQPWPQDWEGTFDLVHQRLVLVAAGPKQKDALLSLCGLVKPGGWIQLIEATNKLPDGCGPNMVAFVDLMKAIFVNLGADLDLAERMPEWLKEAGFVDVNFVDIATKMGATNPKTELAQRGVISSSIAANGLAQFGKNLPAGALTIPAEKLETLGSDLREELKEMGALYPLRVVWARKPL